VVVVVARQDDTSSLLVDDRGIYFRDRHRCFWTAGLVLARAAEVMAAITVMTVLVQGVCVRARFASQPPPSLLLRGGWASKRFFVVVRGGLPCCQPVVTRITRHLHGRQWLVHEITSDQRQSSFNAMTVASG
jgi:hypothetical protein